MLDLGLVLTTDGRGMNKQERWDTWFLDNPLDIVDFGLDGLGSSLTQ